MARAKHYCADCQTHFRADIDVHAREYHDGAPFPGVEHGDFRDYRRLHRWNRPGAGDYT